MDVCNVTFFLIPNKALHILQVALFLCVYLVVLGLNNVHEKHQMQHCVCFVNVDTVQIFKGKVSHYLRKSDNT